MADRDDVHLRRLTKLVSAAAVLAMAVPLILMGYAALGDHTKESQSFYVGVSIGAISMFGFGMAMVIFIGTMNALRGKRGGLG